MVSSLSRMKQAFVVMTALQLCSCNDDVVDNIKPVRFAVTTVAGSGEQGFADGGALAAQFDFPAGIVVDNVGNLFVADVNNFRIRKISIDGTVSTFAGSDSGTADGLGTEAQFLSVRHLAIDAVNNLFVADKTRIRKISPDGVVTTLAGSFENGTVDGIGAEATFNMIGAMTVDGEGNLYVFDYYFFDGNNNFDGNYIRKVTPIGTVTTICKAEFGSHDLARDPEGNFYIVLDGFFLESRIVKITTSNEVVVLAVTPRASSLTYNNSSGEIFFVGEKLEIDLDNEVTRSHYEIFSLSTNSKYTSIAGGEEGFADGIGKNARFRSPSGLAIDPATGSLYMGDSGNYRIRKITRLD